MEWHQLACGIHEATRPMEHCRVCERADAELAERLSMPAPSRWSKSHEAGDAHPYVQAMKEEDMGTFKFDDESRQRAVTRVLGGEPAGAVAAELGVSSASVRNWVKAAGATQAPAPKRASPPKEKGGARSPPAKPNQAKSHAAQIGEATGGPKEPRRSTVADTAPFAHEDVIAFLAKLPPMPWVLGDAIRLLAFHAIDGDRDDVVNARERIDAHLLACGEP